ncbi:helix-turn-helix domain-containing protein [Enterococcus sp. AZ163]|uniref:helix-turn-helix domain-containing protein n=1 Tax=Enterococcus sp. AZ163 TaxID=2774638 RepID=UPI003D268105
MNIGDKIKEQRLKKEWTQEQLGQLLNVSRPTISSWEVGRNYPDLEMIVAISDLFGISLDKLLRGDREMTKDYSKKLRWNKYYKVILGVMALVTILAAGSLAKLRWDEQKYRDNLRAHSWRQETDSQFPDEYKLSEGGVAFYTYILQTGWLPIPLQERHPWVIGQEGNLVVQEKEKNQRTITVNHAKFNGKTYTGSIAVDDQANIIEDKEWSSDKKRAIESFIEEHKKAYVSLLKRTSEKRAEIVQ